MLSTVREIVMGHVRELRINFKFHKLKYLNVKDDENSKCEQRSSFKGPCCSQSKFKAIVVVVVVEILFRIADQTGRFAQYYDGDIIREVNSKEMKCLVHVVYHQ